MRPESSTCFKDKSICCMIPFTQHSRKCKLIYCDRKSISQQGGRGGAGRRDQGALRNLWGWWICWFSRWWFHGVLLLFLSHKIMSNSATPWTVARHSPSVHGISQARTLEWVTIPSSRASSWPREGTLVPCTGRQILYHWAISEAPSRYWHMSKLVKQYVSTL